MDPERTRGVPRPHARPAGRVRPQPPPTAKPIAEPLPPPRSQPPGVVRNFFSQFGPVVEVLVMRDPHNHQSRGFGFITFQREDSAGIVLQNRYHDMLGKRVEVKSAVPRGQAPPPQRGPPRSSQGYSCGQPRRPRPARRRQVRLRRAGRPGYAAGSDNPWGSNPGFNGAAPAAPAARTRAVPARPPAVRRRQARRQRRRRRRRARLDRAHRPRGVRVLLQRPVRGEPVGTADGAGLPHVLELDLVGRSRGVVGARSFRERKDRAREK